MSKRSLQLVSVLTGMVAWEIGSFVLDSPSFPRFTKVVASAWNMMTSEPLIQDILPSLARIVIGFVIGSIGGIMIGVALGVLRALEPWARPLLEFLRAIPSIALIPAALLIFGPTEGMRIGLIAFSAFFPVLLAAIDGSRRVDLLYVDTARVLRYPMPSIAVRIVFPAALPGIFAGLRTALGIAFIVMVIAELTAASNGLGFRIQQAQRLFNTLDVFGGTLIIGLLGLVMSAALARMERRLLAWHRGARNITE